METSTRSSLRAAQIVIVALFVLMAGVALPIAAHAQDDDALTVALFTPNVNFRDGVARNDYIKKVASHLSDATDREWVGKAFARQGDFESALRKGSIDLAVLDGEYFVAKGSKLSPVASLTAGGSTSQSMSLMVRSGSFKALHELRGSRLVLAKAGGYAERFVTGDVLGAELAAKDFFASVDYVKDVRSALNAVELGKADATLAFSTYGDGLSSLHKTSSAPLPVVVVASSRVDGDLLASVKRASRGLSVAGGGLITGAGSYSSDATKRFKGRAAAKRSKRVPELLQPTELELEVGRLRLPDRSDRLRPGSGGESFMLPNLDTLEYL